MNPETEATRVLASFGDEEAPAQRIEEIARSENIKVGRFRGARPQWSFAFQG